jgi:hypothetical protein
LSEPTRTIAVADAIIGTPPSLGADGSVAVLDLTNRRVKFDTSGISGTVTFYAASSSGGTVDVLNTVTIVCGLITAWVQGTPGTGGGWLFNTSANSGHALGMTFD